MLKIDCERLILGYLLDNHYNGSAECILEESAELKQFKSLKKKGRLQLKILGLTISDILEDYINCKDLISDLGVKFPGTFSCVPKVAPLVEQLEFIYQQGLKNKHQVRQVSKSLSKVRNRAIDVRVIQPRTSEGSYKAHKEYMPLCSSIPTTSVDLQDEPYHRCDTDTLLNTSIAEVSDVDADIHIAPIDNAIQLDGPDELNRVPKDIGECFSKNKQSPSKRKGLVHRKNTGENFRKGPQYMQCYKSIINNQEIPEKIADFINQKVYKSDIPGDCITNPVTVPRLISDANHNLQSLSAELSHDPVFTEISELIGYNQSDVPVTGFLNIDQSRSLSTPQPAASPCDYRAQQSSNDALPFIGNALMPDSFNAEIDSHLDRLDCSFVNTSSHDDGPVEHVVPLVTSSVTADDGISAAPAETDAVCQSTDATGSCKVPFTGRKRKRKPLYTNSKPAKRRKSIFDITNDSLSAPNSTLAEDITHIEIDEPADSHIDPVSKSPSVAGDDPGTRSIVSSVGKACNDQTQSRDNASDIETVEHNVNNTTPSSNVHDCVVSSDNGIDANKEQWLNNNSNKQLNVNLSTPSQTDSTQQPFTDLHLPESVDKAPNVNSVSDDSDSSLGSLSQSLLKDVIEADSSTSKVSDDHQGLPCPSPVAIVQKQTAPVTSNTADVDRINTKSTLHLEESRRKECSATDNCATTSEVISISDPNNSKNPIFDLTSMSPKTNSTFTHPNSFSPLQQLQTKIRRVESPLEKLSGYLSGTPDHPGNYTLTELAPLACREPDAEPASSPIDEFSAEKAALKLRSETVVETEETAGPSAVVEVNTVPDPSTVLQLPKKRGRARQSGEMEKSKRAAKNYLRKERAQKLRAQKAKASPVKKPKPPKKASSPKKKSKPSTKASSPKKKSKPSKRALSPVTKTRSAKKKKITDPDDDMSKGITFALNSFRSIPLVPVYSFQSEQITPSIEMDPPSSLPAASSSPQKSNIVSPTMPQLEQMAHSSPPAAKSFSTMKENELYNFSAASIDKLVDRIDSSLSPGNLDLTELLGSNPTKSRSPIQSLRTDVVRNGQLPALAGNSTKLPPLMTHCQKFYNLSTNGRRRSSSVHISPDVALVYSGVCKSTPRNKSHVRTLDFGTPEKDKRTSPRNAKAEANLDFSSTIESLRPKKPVKASPFRPNLSNIHEVSHGRCVDTSQSPVNIDIQNVNEDLYLSDDENQDAVPSRIVAPDSSASGIPALIPSQVHVAGYSIMEDVIGSIETPGRCLDCDNLTLSLNVPTTPVSNVNPSRQAFSIGTDLDITTDSIPFTPQGKSASIRKYPSGPYSDSSEGTPYQPSIAYQLPDNYSPLQADLESILIDVARETELCPFSDNGASRSPLKRKTTPKRNSQRAEDMSQGDIENALLNEISAVTGVSLPVKVDGRKTRKARQPKETNKSTANKEKSTIERETTGGKNKSKPSPKKNRRSIEKAPDVSLEAVKLRTPSSQTQKKTSKKVRQNTSPKKAQNSKSPKNTSAKKSKQKTSPSKNLSKANERRKSTRAKSAENEELSIVTKRPVLPSPKKGQPGMVAQREDDSPLFKLSSDSSDNEATIVSPEKQFQMLERQLALMDGGASPKTIVPKKRVSRSKASSSVVGGTARVLRSRTRTATAQARPKPIVISDDSSSEDSDGDSGSRLLRYKSTPNTPTKRIQEISQAVLTDGAMVAIPTPTKTVLSSASEESDAEEQLTTFALELSPEIDLYTFFPPE